MHTIHIEKVEFAEALRFQFPALSCANCSRLSKIQLVEQDTKVTKFLLFAGVELTLKLELPFCNECLPSATRRPLSLANKILISLLVSAVFATVLLIAFVGSGAEPKVIEDHPILTALALGCVATWLYFSRHRVQAPQTSYYQPVRIAHLKRSFVGGVVQHITFVFTNRDYMLAFSSLNKSVIDAGLVKVADM